MYWKPAKVGQAAVGYRIDQLVAKQFDGDRSDDMKDGYLHNYY